MPKKNETLQLRPLERYIKTYAAFTANDRDIGYEFWLHHGFNYLSGNAFPDLYKGGRIYRSALFAYVMANCLGKDGNLSPPGRKCLMWISAYPEELFRASLYIKAFARKSSNEYKWKTNDFLANTKNSKVQGNK